MKHGSEYAKRVRRLFNQLVRKHGRSQAAELTDPIEQIILAILSSCSSASRAQVVFRKLRQQMVDLNELRVTPPMELAQSLGDEVPEPRRKAQHIVDALNAVRRRQDGLDLSFLRQRGRREAREYLESLDGMDRAAAANVVLYSLGGHAIPVDDLTLYVLRKEEIIDPETPAAEVQGFLERHISASDARTFVELVGRYVGSRIPKLSMEKIRELVNPAPPPKPAAAPQIQPAMAAPGKAGPSPDHAKARQAVKPVAAPAHRPVAAKPDQKIAAKSAKSGGSGRSSERRKTSKHRPERPARKSGRKAAHR